MIQKLYELFQQIRLQKILIDHTREEFLTSPQRRIRRIAMYSGVVPLTATQHGALRHGGA